MPSCVISLHTPFTQLYEVPGGEGAGQGLVYLCLWWSSTSREEQLLDVVWYFLVFFCKCIEKKMNSLRNGTSEQVQRKSLEIIGVGDPCQPQEDWGGGAFQALSPTSWDPLNNTPPN